MKREIIISLFLILFLINIVSAVSIDFNKVASTSSSGFFSSLFGTGTTSTSAITYQPGETALITIQGNFIDPLSSDDLYFYSGRIQVPLIYGLGKIKDKYYVYTLLPDEQRNLSLVVKNAHYIENSKEYKQDLVKNFTVSGEEIAFSISPGLIITNKDFSIKITSKNKALTVSSDFLGKKQEINVPASQSKKIDFSISDIKNFTVTDIKISGDSVTYTIPTAIITQTQQNDTSLISKKFRFSPSSDNISIALNSKEKLNIELINTGESRIENISIIISDELKDILTFEDKKINLDEDESEELVFDINSDKIGYFSGEIEAKSKDLSAIFDLSLYIVGNITNNNQSLKYCAYLGGEKCDSGQTCNGTVQASLEGNCCIGNCYIKKSPSFLTFFLVIFIILILAGLGYFILKRYKKSGKSSSEVLKVKQDLSEKRFRGEEVRGKLSKE